jgi:hypothetical protein
VIRHKLTFYSISEEFFETFISWDNKFLKTFLHLFSKPQEVAKSYLNGVRKRYMKPFPYIIISLTLYGIYMYFGKEKIQEYMEYVTTVMPNPQNLDKKALEFQQAYNKKMFKIITNYFNVFTFMMIPFMASINLLIFRRKNNFIEHNVLLLYSYGHYMYFYVLFSFIGLIFNIPLVSIYQITIAFMILYHMYFFKKLYDLSFLQIVLKTILYWLGLFVLTFIVSILILVTFVVVIFLLKALGIF